LLFEASSIGVAGSRSAAGVEAKFFKNFIYGHI
jgi:hypothetical protein